MRRVVSTRSISLTLQLGSHSWSDLFCRARKWVLFLIMDKYKVSCPTELLVDLFAASTSTDSLIRFSQLQTSNCYCPPPTLQFGSGTEKEGVTSNNIIARGRSSQYIGRCKDEELVMLLLLFVVCIATIDGSTREEEMESSRVNRDGRLADASCESWRFTLKWSTNLRVVSTC